MFAVPHRPETDLSPMLPQRDALAGRFDAQLRQLQKMEVVGALTAGAAHDFNNLLLAVRGNVGLLLMDPKLDPATRARLDQVELAAARASELSQRLLAIGRACEPKIAVIDFNRVLHEASQLATCALRSRVAIDVLPAAEPPLVLMDFTAAVQMILTLCLNAGDAMPPKSRGGRVTLSNEIAGLDAARAARAGCAPGDSFVCCRVADNGAGIPPELLSQIFAPFFTTKPAGQGTGMGLAMVQQAVQRAGGIVEVESVLDVGTTFQILLPLAPHSPHP